MNAIMLLEGIELELSKPSLALFFGRSTKFWAIKNPPKFGGLHWINETEQVYFPVCGVVRRLKLIRMILVSLMMIGPENMVTPTFIRMPVAW